MRFDKTVLQVIPALDAGGAERTTIEMTRAIVEAGGRALVATSGGRLCGEVERVGGRVFVLPVAAKDPLTIFLNRGRLATIIGEERAAIIHARSRAPAWSALMAARATGAAFVTTYHGAYAANSPLKRFLNSSMARGDLVIANSSFTADSIRANYEVADRLAIIPRGADLEQFNPEGISKARLAGLRRAWGLVENPQGLVFLLPGRLTDWKGHRIAIEAMARLGRINGGPATPTGVYDNFQLIFAGGEQGRGDYAASLTRWVNEFGLQRMISMVGHCDDMPAAYALCDAVLAPSTRPEAFGRVAVEAGAMRKIVIAADHGGARETIIDRETGLLVKPGAPDALAIAIDTVAAMDDETRAAMGAAARSRIEKLFSTQAMTTATLAAYDDLLARRTNREGSL